MPKILIVEDDADLVETYTDLLEVHQYSVTSAMRSQDAITLVVRVRPHIILLDLNLAGYSGTVVINMVRGYLPLKTQKLLLSQGTLRCCTIRILNALI